MTWLHRYRRVFDLNMARVSYTAEGFRAAFRRPSVTLAELTWRWCVGAVAWALIVFTLREYLNSLPVTNADLLLLRTRMPSVVWQVISHILRGTLGRLALAQVVGAVAVAGVWVLAASIGRAATVQALVEYFSSRTNLTARKASDEARQRSNGLVSLNVLRAAWAIALIFGLLGAAILVKLIVESGHHETEYAVPLFVFFASLVLFGWWTLDWLLKLATVMSAAGEGRAVVAIESAITLCRERTGALLAVSVWTWLVHLVAFSVATSVVFIPMGFAAVLPWALVIGAMLGTVLLYFAIIDWLHVARLAGYVCIAEFDGRQAELVAPAPMLPNPQSMIDPSELILSDVPANP